MSAVARNIGLTVSQGRDGFVTDLRAREGNLPNRTGTAAVETIGRGDLVYITSTGLLSRVSEHTHTPVGVFAGTLGGERNSDNQGPTRGNVPYFVESQYLANSNPTGMYFPIDQILCHIYADGSVAQSSLGRFFPFASYAAPDANGSNLLLDASAGVATPTTGSENRFKMQLVRFPELPFRDTVGDAFTLCEVRLLAV